MQLNHIFNRQLVTMQHLPYTTYYSHLIGETILLTTSGGVMGEDQMDLCLLEDFKMITLTCGETD